MGMKAKDLAKALGVSPATISLVLNNKPGISDSLRASLLEKIQELGCEDMMSEACRSGAKPGERQPAPEGNPSIAYLSYMDCEEDDVNYFFPGVLEGAEVEARANGFGFSVLHRKCYPDVSLRELLANRGNIVGAIIQGDDITPDVIADTKNVDIPFVFMDVYDASLKLSSVQVDNFESMFKIVDYLKKKGHREIGYVFSGWDTDWKKNRQGAFRCAAEDMGLPVNSGYFFSANTTEDPYETNMLAELFSDGRKLPTALVCENDRQAMRAIRALEKSGKRVPEDVSVVGFDNSPLAKMITPKLTTVRNSSHLMGRECVVLLQNLLRLRKAGIEVSHLTYALPTELIERDSVKDLNEK